MKASQTYQCIVKFDGAGFWTNTIQKQRATCTWSDKVAASALPNGCLARTTPTSPVCRHRQATTKSASRAAGNCPVEIPRR